MKRTASAAGAADEADVREVFEAKRARSGSADSSAAPLGLPGPWQGGHWTRQKNLKHGLITNRWRKLADGSTIEMQLANTSSTTFFDLDDLEFVRKYRWHFVHGYARRTTRVDGRTVCVYMHRELASTPQGMYTDHIDRNTLNNRKRNLRSCTQSTNMRNTSMRSTNFTGYTDISEYGRLQFNHYVDGRTAKVQKGYSVTTAGAEASALAYMQGKMRGKRSRHGRTPRLLNYQLFRVQVCSSASDGATKGFGFERGNADDRARALNAAIAFRDAIQARTNCTNGKQPRSTL